MDMLTVKLWSGGGVTIGAACGREAWVAYACDQNDSVGVHILGKQLARAIEHARSCEKCARSNENGR